MLSGISLWNGLLPGIMANGAWKIEIFSLKTPKATRFVKINKALKKRYLTTGKRLNNEGRTTTTRSQSSKEEDPYCLDPKRRRSEDVVAFLVKSQAVRTIDHGQNQQHRTISGRNQSLAITRSFITHLRSTFINSKKRKRTKKRMRRTLLLGDPSQHGSWSLLVP
ncbi:hypothetical protein CEXT_240821 [Caerostris extrusa]|uniref:Uncharacterized protein n=1 Tax=Caerostris extrusa TaxID=172846 RepID=A0AAV4XGG4_CAEEX|nr:hypothetical protein CEXT_240821 [Caerostris extrusa]